MHAAVQQHTGDPLGSAVGGNQWVGRHNLQNMSMQMIVHNDCSPVKTLAVPDVHIRSMLLANAMASHERLLLLSSRKQQFFQDHYTPQHSILSTLA